MKKAQVLTKQLNKNPFQRMHAYCTAPARQLEIEQKLASGGFADVYRVRYQNQTYALKDLRKFYTNNQEQCMNEIAIHHKLPTHDHVIDIGPLVLTGKRELVGLLLEYSHVGDLAKKIYSDVPIEWSEKTNYAQQILSGINFLHAKGIIHSDIKPENILIFGEQQLKICDFGLAIQVATENIDQENPKIGDVERDKTKGTPVYLAPEALTDKIYSSATDIYAFAITLYSIINRDEAWSDISRVSMFFTELLVNKAKPGKLIADTPAALNRVYENCGSFEPEARPTAKEALAMLSTQENASTSQTTAKKPTVTTLALYVDIFSMYSKVCKTGKPLSTVAQDNRLKY